LQHGVVYDTSIRMLRLRFSSGVILGLVLGIMAGGVIAVLLTPAPPPTDQGAMALQVQELTRKLEAARDDRQRVDKQLEQFQKLAEQMTASFNNLDQRFKALQEEQRLQETAAKQAAVPTVPQAPSPAATVPQLQPPQAPAASTPAAANAAPSGADNAPPPGDQ